MGFSVSGATAVILVGLFVAFAMAYPAAIGGFERISDAHNANADRLLERQNTDIDLHAATYNESDATVMITVNNTGAHTLTVSGTNVLLDGSYAENKTATIDEHPTSDLWLPDEGLVIEVNVTSQPDRVQVVTENGLAVAGPVDDDGGNDG